jgi:hypothetical protein
MDAGLSARAAPEGSTPEAPVRSDRPNAPAFFSHLEDADFANEDALIEAGERYGDDADRELADLEAGRHPLQRPR